MPVRMCVICRGRFPKAALTRHVASEAGTLVRDERARLLGRGWYVCADPVCRKRFEKYALGKRKGKIA